MALCGIHRDGMFSSLYPWVLRWGNACQARKDVATTIDRRWPSEMRGENSMRVAPSAGSEWQPFSCGGRGFLRESLPIVF